MEAGRILCGSQSAAEHARPREASSSRHIQDGWITVDLVKTPANSSTTSLDVATSQPPSSRRHGSQRLLRQRRTAASSTVERQIDHASNPDIKATERPKTRGPNPSSSRTKFTPPQNQRTQKQSSRYK